MISLINSFICDLDNDLSLNTDPCDLGGEETLAAGEVRHTTTKNTAVSKSSIISQSCSKEHTDDQFVEAFPEYIDFEEDASPEEDPFVQKNIFAESEFIISNFRYLEVLELHQS